MSFNEHNQGLPELSKAQLEFTRKEDGCLYVDWAEDSGTVSADAAAPELASTGDSASAAMLVAAMWNHAPVMKKAILREGRPWPELTGGDLRDLGAYLSSQAPAP